MIERAIMANGVSLNVRDWGGQGPALVLLHGLASTSHIWDLAAPLLAQRARVVAFDQRGHGLSQQPADGYDFATVVADLDAVLQELSIARPILVGHSWGGNV